MASDTSISLDTSQPTGAARPWDAVRLLRDLILPLSSAVAWRLGTSRAIITALHPASLTIPVAEIARRNNLRLVDIQNMEPSGPGIEIAALVQPESSLELTLLLNPRPDGGNASSFSLAVRLDAPTAATTLLDRIDPLLQDPRFVELVTEDAPGFGLDPHRGHLVFERFRTVTEGTTLKLYFRQPAIEQESLSIN